MNINIMSSYFTLWCYFVKIFVHVIRKNHICYTNQSKYYIMKKIERNDLKKVQGGKIPYCCLKWNPLTRVCSEWDANCLNP